MDATRCLVEAQVVAEHQFHGSPVEIGMTLRAIEHALDGRAPCFRPLQGGSVPDPNVANDVEFRIMAGGLALKARA